MAATGASVTLTGDAALTVTAAPAPLVDKKEVQGWHWVDFRLIPPTSFVVHAGGVRGAHSAIASAALTATEYTASGSGGHSLGNALLQVTETPSTVGNTALYTGAALDITAPIFPAETPNELVYFPVTGFWNDVESPDISGNTNQPLYQIISGYVTFYPRVPVGFTALIENLDNGTGVGADTAVALAPIQVRIMSGQLSTINRNDTPGVQLLANSPLVSQALAAIDPIWLEKNFLAPGQLVYDVKFSNVVYASAAQVVTNFAFVASTDGTQICITDPGIARLPYNGPN